MDIDNPRGESGCGGGIPILVFLDQSGPIRLRVISVSGSVEAASVRGIR